MPTPASRYASLPVFLIGWWIILLISWVLFILIPMPGNGGNFHPISFYTNWALFIHVIGLGVIIVSIDHFPVWWWWFLHGTSWVVFLLSSFLLFLNPGLIAGVDPGKIGIRFLLERFDHVLPLVVILLVALKYTVYPSKLSFGTYILYTYIPLVPLTIYLFIFDVREVYGIDQVTNFGTWVVSVVIVSIVNGILLYERQLDFVITTITATAPI